MQVIFSCVCDKTSFGDYLAIFGNTPELNRWKPDETQKSNILSTTGSDYPTWNSCPLTFNDETRGIEFKFVIFSKTKVIWETCKNRQVDFTKYKNAKNLRITATFNKDELNISINEKEVSEDSDEKNGFTMSTQTDLSQLSEIKATSDFFNNDVSLRRFDERQKKFTMFADNPILSVSRLHSLWGRSFERPTEHYVASASTTSLETILEVLLTKNKSSHSFLQKLEIVAEMIQSSQSHLLLQVTDTVRLLTAIVLYLTWIHSGLIPCKESGSHFRPYHHATIAKKVFDEITHLNLECKKIVGPLMSSKTSVIILTRLILPLLPSFQPQFTCAAPLTRIRDIAHRNDIPVELKNEIKHTIQNKLHRNAGPEDLIATEKLLKRLMDQREKYSSDFMTEFTKFHQELKEFFNAQSLEDRLKDLRVSGDSEFLFSDAEKPAALQHWRQLASDFYRSKAELKHKTKQNNSLEYQTVLLNCLQSATRLRRCLVLAIEQNMNSERLWLTDIALEQYSFALLSQLNQELELVASSELKFTHEYLTLALTSLNLSVLQIQYNGVFQAQCHAIAVILNRMLHALSLKPEADTTVYLQSFSVVEQVRQLIATVTDDMSSIFGFMVEYLASQLNVPLESVSVFAEATIRASLFFQVSRLASAIFSQVSLVLNESGVDIISEPQALPAYLSGRLVCVETLDNMEQEILKGPKNVAVILLLNKATGDEQLEGLLTQRRVEAIILTHPIPSLSHLGIRARQNRVPFLSVLHEKTELFQECHKLIGKDATLIWTENNEVEVKSFQDSTSIVQQIILRKKKTFNKQLSLNSSLLKPQDIELASDVLTAFPVIHLSSPLINCPGLGTKAETCIRLHKIGMETGMFETPKCFVLPYGCMEKAIEDLKLRNKYITLLNNVEEFSSSNVSPVLASSAPCQLPALDECCDDLQSFILGEVVPTEKHLDELNKILESSFLMNQDTGISLAIRSSANVEDLEQRSGAGLYDSVLNVSISQDSLASAISKVWASLYSSRAVSWRRALCIPQTKARMAVLIQNIMEPDYCFVAHTISTVPLHAMKKAIHRTKEYKDYVIEPNEWIYVEIAQGFGEVIASASVQGHPHKMLIHKKTDAYVMFGFATLPYKYAPSTSKPNHLSMLLADYSKDLFWISAAFRNYFAQQLKQVCMTLENIFQHPQDIEGGIKVSFDTVTNIDEETFENSSKIMIVQSRAQLV